ncbi:MAG: hypothetical protein ACXVUE_21910 [Solirubrobacteraceae bacterium]
MRQAISDPTAGEKAREIAGAADRRARPLDPTEPQPVGHVLGHRRDEPLPTQDPGAPVLRLRGFRRVWRGGKARRT